MGSALKEYVFQRVHQCIQSPDREWRQIRIKGSLRRTPPALKAQWETDRPARPFNFQRPTAVIDDDTIDLCCFPSQSFVEHYRIVIAAYLYSKGKSDCSIPIPPSSKEPLETFQQSNLRVLGPTDIVIFGEVHCLPNLPPGRWWETPSESQETDDLFAWQKFTSPTGRTVTLLGCKEGLWGEAGSAIVHALKEFSGISCALYVGKVGALAGEYTPNEYIATGNVAYFDKDTSVKWKSPLERSLIRFPEVATGRLVTVDSPLRETKEWLQDWKDTATWVDCDTGHMARAANELGVEFGYLHIVSDNLAAKSNYGLSNEEIDGVKAKRNNLYKKMEGIIDVFISSWNSEADLSNGIH